MSDFPQYRKLILNDENVRLSLKRAVDHAMNNAFDLGDDVIDVMIKIARDNKLNVLREDLYRHADDLAKEGDVRRFFLIDW